MTDKAVNKLASFISNKLLLFISARLIFAGGGIWGLIASRLLLLLARKLVVPAAHKTALFAAHRIVLPAGKRSVRFLHCKLEQFRERRTEKIRNKKLEKAAEFRSKQLQEIRGNAVTGAKSLLIVSAIACSAVSASAADTSLAGQTNEKATTRLSRTNDAASVEKPNTRVSTRLSRPSRLNTDSIAPAEIETCNHLINPLEGTQHVHAGGASILQFSGVLAGVSSRWWRNFRNPSFCPFIICGGTCANIMGVPIVGSYTASQLMSNETPCSIESVESSGGCCMHNGSNSMGAVASESENPAASDCCSAK
ncbi:MAG: hypothetical protein K2X77_02210 [Candidatus Obscuribacterales bacterium]|jgi:hypothetical protein|nr:hypothetical protein [Candidatus Obscuribacterales bacterium]